MTMVADPRPGLNGFEIKDSGERTQFEGGMVRDTAEDKTSFLNVRFGPMLRRWADHLTGGRKKYPDPEPGIPNWTLAEGVEEFLRAKDSAARHFEAWLAGARDEDHAAGVFFNINLAEYVLQKASNHGREIDPSLGVVSPSLYADPELPHWSELEPRACDHCEVTAPHSHIEDRPLQVGDRVRTVTGREGVIVTPTYPEQMMAGEIVVDFGGSSGPWYQEITELERVESPKEAPDVTAYGG